MTKSNIKPLLAILLTIVLFAACKKDREEVVPLPVINGLEIGSNNNKIAYAGGDIHLEGKIVAPGNIASLALVIHPKTGEGWKFEKIYTEGLVGLKNAEFHQHIDIPAATTLGIYHIHIKITDQLGQVKEIEADFEIKKDLTLPSITGFEAVPNASGTDLHLEAAVDAPNKIAKMIVEIHGGTYEKEVAYTDAAMIGQISYKLHKHINITDAPLGHYHVHLRVIDQAGKEMEFETHFDKK